MWGPRRVGASSRGGASGSPAAWTTTMLMKIKSMATTPAALRAPTSASGASASVELKARELSSFTLTDELEGGGGALGGGMASVIRPGTARAGSRRGRLRAKHGARLVVVVVVVVFFRNVYLSVFIYVTTQMRHAIG